MRKIALTVTAIVFLSIFPSVSSGQSRPAPNPVPIAQSSGLHNGIQSLSSTGTLRTLVIGGLLTGLATNYDSRSQSMFSKAPLGKSAIMDMGDNYGNGGYLLALSGATWGTGMLFGSSDLKTTGEKMVLGLAADGALVTSIKLLTRRKRPDGSDLRSFPSGHTSGAFTISTILSRRYGWRLGVPAFALATLTAMDRMEDGKHYASDVVAGATIGIIMGRMVTAPADHAPSRLQVIPAGMGAKLSLAF